MITPHLTAALAQARIDDLRRAADARRVPPDLTEPARWIAPENSVTLRFGSAGDQKSLALLAALDGARPPEPPVLLAEIDGHLHAALALADGRVVADPFRRTADLIDLLRARARQLDGHSRMSRTGRLLSWARRCPPSPGEPINQAAPAS